MRKLTLLIAAIAVSSSLAAKDYTLESPDKSIRVSISDAGGVSYRVERAGTPILAKSCISMTLADGTVFGAAGRFKATKRSVDVTLPVANFKRSSVRDNFNELKLSAKKYDIVFRAYDDGVAYRFISKCGKAIVKSEQAEFNFAEDWPLFVPYVREKPQGSFDEQYFNSFENTYAHHKLSEWQSGRLSFLPLTVEAKDGITVCVTESDLDDYPGMFLFNGDASSRLAGVFAPVPDKVEQGGHNQLQGMVKTRKDFIAECEASRAFPWRVVAIVPEARLLAQSDLTWRLGAPAEERDWSWVKPGKVAWDWWNAWNIYGVDFEAGINNDTYKYYIDFAAANGIEYVILDEGWAVKKQADLMQVIPEIDLPELCAYAEKRNVGLILWAGYWAFNRDMEGVCKHYSQMGIKGWKIDFMNRDDQQIVRFCKEAAEIAAKYNMIVDFHGMFKPAGMQRTWPNVLNFEGVYGLEQAKGINPDADLVTYDVTIPFTRLFAGPSDYTQGAMHNANRKNFRYVYSEPMSPGTRCHQLAEYIIFDAPFTMLCDSPSNYLQEPECTEFIASVPTVWDETIALDGKIAEYVVIARRSGDTWYVGALGNWDARELEIDLSPLGIGKADGEVYADGVNAHRVARDYRHEGVTVDGKWKVKLAPGGGAVLVL